MIYIIIILIFVIIFNCYNNYLQNADLLIIEGIDGNNYYVRENFDKDNAAETLYKLRQNLKKVRIGYLTEK